MANRIKNLTKTMKMIEVFRFKDIEDLYCDMQGNFFYKYKPTKKVYNNGSISIICGKTKKGLISLRKKAYKVKIEKQEIPF